MTTKFRVGKTYKTKDNLDVVVIHVDNDLGFPIVGVVTADNGLKSVCTWRGNGEYASRSFPMMDLVVLEPVVKKYWINVYVDEKLFELMYYPSEIEALHEVTLDKDGYIGTFPFTFEVPGDE